MAQETRRLEASEVYQQTDVDLLAFETTKDLELLDYALGQPRAVEALQFGIEMRQDGYNIFALGPVGMGRRELVEQAFEKQAEQDETPSSWCYVNNFEESHKPQAIRLPPGMGITFREDMEDLVEELRHVLPAALESEEYQTRRQSIQQEFNEKQAESFEELQQKAREKDVAIIRTSVGLAVVPVRDGEPMSPDELDELSEEAQEELKGKVSEIQEALQQQLRQVPAWQRELREKLRELDREIAQFAVGGLIDELREKYDDFPEVLDYLDAVEQDVVENAQDFLSQEEMPNGLQALQNQARRPGGEEALRRYRVNVLVDHEDAEGAPVVYEDNPTYQNLIGRVEHQARMGALLTDFNLIKPGALHRANGGYLILDARKVLTQPYAWEGLKRVLLSGQVRIESIGQMLSLISTISLEPEPIPLDVKIALVGERLLYYLLYQLDPEFAELFKVEADFEEQMERTGENVPLYARLLGSIAEREGLRPLDRSGVARVIEHGARMVGDAERLSIRMRTLTDLLQEANHWAGKADREAIAGDDVQHAIDAQIFRADRIRERVQEGILRETILIDTEGEVVGQINGLSVLMLGNFAFGRPTRITARIRMGKGEVVDIEREVELGGPIHSKGVLILTVSWVPATPRKSPSRCRPAWFSSSLTVASRATALPRPSCTVCSPPSPACPSSNRWQ